MIIRAFCLSLLLLTSLAFPVDQTPANCSNVDLYLQKAVSQNENMKGLIKDTIPQAITDVTNIISDIQTTCYNINDNEDVRDKQPSLTHLQQILQKANYISRNTIEDPDDNTSELLNQVIDQVFTDDPLNVCNNAQFATGALLNYLNWLGQNYTLKYLDGIIANRTADLAEVKNNCPNATNITVIGAVYGKVNVTELVRQKLQGSYLQVNADDKTLGTSTDGYLKTLVIVYQDGDRKPQTSITLQNETAYLISNNTVANQTKWVRPALGNLVIFGAAWGVGDVTDAVAGLVDNNNLNTRAGNEVFDDPGPYDTKTLVVVYQDLFGTKIAVTEEGYELHICSSSSPLKILGASYGKANVTEQVNSLVNGEVLQVQATDQIFGADNDNNYYYTKTLVVVYQRCNNQPTTSITSQYDTVTLYPNSTETRWPTPQAKKASEDDQTNKLIVLGAAWGSSVVTDFVISQVKYNSLSLRANNNSKNQWPYYDQVLTVVYQDSEGLHTVTIDDENSFYTCKTKDSLHILGAAYGRDVVTDELQSSVQNGSLTVQANNDVFGDSFENANKTLVIVYQRCRDKPQMVITRENNTASLTSTNYVPQKWTGISVGQLSILGAAYGLTNVTPKVTSLTADNELLIVANDTVFNSTATDSKKTLVVVYKEAEGVSTAVVEEGQELDISYGAVVTVLSVTGETGSPDNGYNRGAPMPMAADAAGDSLATASSANAFGAKSVDAAVADAPMAMAESASVADSAAGSAAADSSSPTAGTDSSTAIKGIYDEDNNAEFDLGL